MLMRLVIAILTGCLFFFAQPAFTIDVSSYLRDGVEFSQSGNYRAALVQFNHRVMGYLLFIMGTILWMRGTRKVNSTRYQVTSYHLFYILLLLQVCVGIAALLTSVPLYLGLAHQFVAMLLLLSLLNLKFELHRGRKNKD